MRPLRILHLSDLHERAAFDGMPDSRGAKLLWDAEERGILLGKRFEEALEAVAKDGIDLVCFTGDLADWANPAEYAAATRRLSAVLQLVKVPQQRFFAVPGNHDVQRPMRQEAWKGLRDWYARTQDGATLGRWMRGVEAAPPGIDPAWRDEILERTESFWRWMESFERGDLRPQPPKRLGYRKTLPRGSFVGIGANVHIVGLDSAWLCGDDNDQGRILLSEEQVQAHIRNGERALDGFRIALVHHPLDHLADHHHVRRLLGDDGIDLLLHGHQHTALVFSADEPGAALRILAAGCLMEGDRGKAWPNEFHVIEVDVESRAGAVHFRKWSHDGRYWAPGSDLYREAPDGVLRWPHAAAEGVETTTARDDGAQLQPTLPGEESQPARRKIVSAATVVWPVLLGLVTLIVISLVARWRSAPRREAARRIELCEKLVKQGLIAQAVDEYKQALKAAHASSDAVTIARAACGLGHYLVICGEYKEARQVLEKECLASAVESGDERQRAAGLLSLATLEAETGNTNVAMTHVSSVLPMFVAQSDCKGEVDTLVLRANLHTLRGQMEAAREDLAKATGRCDACGAADCRGQPVLALGKLQLLAGDLHAARRNLERGEKLFDAAGDPLGQAQCHLALGDLDRQSSNVQAARTQYAIADGLFSKAGLRAGEASIALLLGGLESDEQAAAGYLKRAGDYYRALGSTLGVAHVERSLGDLKTQLGHFEEARAHYQRALQIYRDNDDAFGRTGVLYGMGRLEGLADNYELGKRHYLDALAIGQSLDSLFEARVFNGLGRIEEMQGDIGDAKKHLLDARARFQAKNDRHGEANTMRILGAVAADELDFETARQNFLVAVDLYQKADDPLGVANALADEADSERALNRLDESVRHVAEADGRCKDLRNTACEANVHLIRARLKESLGKPVEAAAEYDAARALFHSTGTRRDEADVDFGQGLLLLQQRRWAEARTLLTRAQQMFATLQLEALAEKAEATAARATKNIH